MYDYTKQTTSILCVADMDGLCYGNKNSFSFSIAFSLFSDKKNSKYNK